MTKERKRAEEALRESEERYRRLVEMSPYAIAVHSEERMIFVNRAGTELLGATDPEEIIGRPLWDFVHPDYLKAVRKRIQRAEPAGSKVDLVEEKLVRLDGQTIDAEIAAIPITYQGKPARQVVFRDIGKRKRAEEALRESEEKYRDPVENINDVIYQLDAEGRVTYISPIVEEVGGYSPSEIVGRPFTEFAHPEDVPALVERFRKALAGDPQPIEYRLLLKSGETRWYRSFGREILEGDRVLGFRGVQTDITERKRAEEALRESEVRYRRPSLRPRWK